MKKLMVALSAVALAFGVHAAESWATGTGFEGGITPPVPLAENQSVGELETAASWSIPTLGADESLTITAGDTGLAGDAVPEKFSQTTSLNYLDIHTQLGNPVTRNINAAGDPQDITANGIYFDSLVKITACDTAPEADYQPDAKLMVYALENEETGATNLFIRAGQIQTDGTVAATDYDCGEFTYAGQWVRLTIKAIDDIVAGDDVCPGFVVFFGGNNATGVNPKTCSTSKNLSTTIKFTAAATAFGNALFPAYVESLSGAANSKLTGVAFAGQGAVDDIVFNDAAPFQQAQDKQFATLAWNEGVTGFTCSYDSVDYSKSGLTGAGSVDIVFNPDTTSLEVTGITYAEGKFGDSSKEFDPIAADGTYTLTAKTANVTIGDQKFETFAEAITYINGTASGALTVNFAAGFEPEDFATTIIPAAGVTSLTIDLAGKTLTYTGATGYAIDSAVPLTIKDSVGGGVLLALGTSDGAVKETGAGNVLTITGGKIDGIVSVPKKGEATSLVSGGMFKEYYEGVFPLTCDGGFTATLKDGYWTVAAIPTFTVTVVEPEDGSHVTLSSITVDGVAVQTPAAGGYTAEKSVVVVYALDTGYQLADASAELTQSFDAADTTTVPTAEAITYGITYVYKTNTVEIAAQDIADLKNDNPIKFTVEDAITIAAANITAKDFDVSSVDNEGWAAGAKTDNVTVTVTLTEKAPVIDPVVPGEDIKTDKTPEEINKNIEVKKQFLKAPEGAAVTDTYYGYFDAVTGSQAGTVKFVLNSAGETALKSNVADEIVKIKPAKVADATQTTVEVTPVPGFYYAVKQGDGIGNMKVVEAGELAKSDATLSLNLQKYTGAGFYKLIVSPLPIPAEN